MNYKNNLIIFALFIFLFQTSPLFSDSSQVTVSISKLSGYIGEHFEINLILKSQTRIQSIKTEIKSDNFEVLEKKDIRTETNNSYQIFEKKIKIAFWKTGNFKIAPIKIKTIRNNEIIETLETNQLEVTILSSLEKKKNSEKDLKPIKPLAKVIGSILYFLRYLFILVVLVLLIIVIFLYIRKKMKHKKITPQIKKTPVEEFNTNFRDLENKKLIVSGKLKLYFLKLTEITKRFLTRQYSFNAEELTTFETIMVLREREKHNTVKEKLDLILSFSDKVKFAKFIPNPEDKEALNTVIKELLDTFIERQTIRKVQELERVKRKNGKKTN